MCAHQGICPLVQEQFRNASRTWLAYHRLSRLHSCYGWELWLWTVPVECFPRGPRNRALTLLPAGGRPATPARRAAAQAAHTRPCIGVPSSRGQGAMQQPTGEHGMETVPEVSAERLSFLEAVSTVLPMVFEHRDGKGRQGHSGRCILPGISGPWKDPQVSLTALR